MNKAPKINRDRGKTAKEMGLKIGVSARTIRSYIALDRQDYLEKAEARRKQAYELRQAGKKFSEIATELKTTRDTVVALVQREKKLLKDKASWEKHDVQGP
jgi:DNA-binding CsgD family transcriptional regulator